MRARTMVVAVAAAMIGMVSGALLTSQLFLSVSQHSSFDLYRLSDALGVMYLPDGTPTSHDQMRELLALQVAQSLFLAAQRSEDLTPLDVERLNRAIHSMDSWDVTSLVRERDAAELADRVIECWRNATGDDRHRCGR